MTAGCWGQAGNLGLVEVPLYEIRGHAVWGAGGCCFASLAAGHPAWAVCGGAALQD